LPNLPRRELRSDNWLGGRKESVEHHRRISGRRQAGIGNCPPVWLFALGTETSGSI
jgi:hypothetical protein